jgi:histidinol dehydrogenase
MLAVPARIAEVPELVVCTPPDRHGKISPAIEATLAVLGISDVVLCGGAQAIGVLAYGTGTVAKVDKIFGPGNRYVTLAKETVARQGTAIDVPAGPSELLLIADESQNPAWIAADLLSQCEHGADSEVLFVCWSEDLLGAVQREVDAQWATLPRRDLARESLERSSLILVDGLDQALTLSDAYAPEHLILALDDAASAAARVQNAGAVFLGTQTPESIGD